MTQHTSQELFLSYITRKKPDQCWPWNGPARVYFEGRCLNPRRIAYNLFTKGEYKPFAAKTQLRVVCHNFNCMNPAHAVTRFAPDERRSQAYMTPARLATPKAPRKPELSQAEKEAIRNEKRATTAAKLAALWQDPAFRAAMSVKLSAAAKRRVAREREAQALITGVSHE